MKRKNFIWLAGVSALSAAGLGFRARGMASEPVRIQPALLYFKDDGRIPNSKYPLLLYRNAFAERDDKGAEWLEQEFASHNWTNTWRWGIYTFHHYHSNTHEVLGVFKGSGLLHLGGENGQKVTVQAGDIIVIPAGVGHKCISSDGLTVVGAYPNGLSPDLNRGEPGERPGTDKNIAAVSFPATDPLLGQTEGLRKLWK
ncbi:MAG TPA: cupin domain-containing protein [Puia sp.]